MDAADAMTANPDAAPLLLDVRLHGGRAVRYPVAGEFLVGSASGCDLLLPGANLPPVVCQFSNTGSGLRFRRIAAEVFLNQTPLHDDAPREVKDGDRVKLGPVEITLVNAERALIHPKLIPLEAEPTLQQSAIDEQVRELEEDRRLWYARRQAMEAELAEMKARGDAQKEELAKREAELQRHREELNAVRHSLTEEYETKRDELARMLESVRRETEALNAGRAELEQQARELHEGQEQDFARRQQEWLRERELRQREMESALAQDRLKLEEELQGREPLLAQLRMERAQTESARQTLETERAAIAQLRQDLAGERRGYDAERQWQTERIEKLEADLAGREADLARREAVVHQETELLEASKATHKEDLLRLNRWQAQLEDRDTALNGRAAEIDERYRQMLRDAAELEDQVRQADLENERLQSESARLVNLRKEIDSQSGKFTERSAALEAQQAALAILRVKLDRRQEELREESETIAAERQKNAEARRELDARYRDAELLQEELGFLRDDHAAKHRAVTEQQSLFEATVEEVRRQREEIAAAEVKLKEREEALEAQALETAEQAATLKSKLLQALELQQRLEADRLALRDREIALAEGEAARQALQEQIRKRTADLGGREKHLDTTAREIAEEKAILDRGRETIAQWRANAEAEIRAMERDAEARRIEIERQNAALAERDATMQRQVARMREVGVSLAAERKQLFEARQLWEAENSANRQKEIAARYESEAFQARVAEQVAELRRQAPDLEHRAAEALEKLNASKASLKEHLAELHEFAKQSRTSMQQDGDALREREQFFEQARAEHRGAVAAFRQQVLEWQAKVLEVQQSFQRGEHRVSDRQNDLDATAKRLEQMEKNLKRREAEIEDERRVAEEKRNEMERHLADMREWYRKKLRSLAQGRAVDDSDMPAWEMEEAKPDVVPMSAARSAADLDPADERLGEILRSRGFVDDNILLALTNEAKRQRKTLRQTLLASGVVTVFQLALIEAGNLDGLAVGRFKVIDRLRATTREQVFRVYDPSRPGAACVLRLLQETDESRRAEYHQSFAAAAGVKHPNLVNVLEVLEVQGRSAVLMEAVSGTPSTEWPPLAAVPGVWLKLMLDAVRAVDAVHQQGLVHGHLSAEVFLLGPDGTLKISGLGEPAWLAGPPNADLKALGRVAYNWSQIGAKRRTNKSKPFPAELAAIVRRLEAGSESAMDDIIPLERPYANAAELLSELEVQEANHHCPADVWQKLIRNLTDGEAEPLRATA